MKSTVLDIKKLKETAAHTMPAGSSVWLYGSRARGEARKDSDWDLLIILDKAEISTEDFDRYGYPFIVLGWQYGADVSPQLYTREEWSQREYTPYYMNVEQDKKVVYGA